MSYLCGIDEVLRRSRPSSTEAKLAHAELSWASDLLKAACKIGKARLAIGFTAPIATLDAGTREGLAAELAELVERHRKIWLSRNRPGGLLDSAGQMERVLSQLRAQA
jgi:hypothetical protein